MTKFKSDTILNLLNAGQTEIDQLTREEAKTALNGVVNAINIESKYWIQMVVQRYLGKQVCWKPETISSRLQELEHDINLLRNKLYVEENDKSS